MNDALQLPYYAAMPFGVTLNRVFKLLRANWRLLIGVSLAPAAVIIALYALLMVVVVYFGILPLKALGGQPPDPIAVMAMFRIIFPAAFVASVPMSAVFAFYLAAIFHATNKADAGIAVSIGESNAVAWSQLGRYWGLLFWIYFRAFGPALVIVLGMFACSGLLTMQGPNPNPAVFVLFPLGMLLYFAAYVYGAIVALRLSLAFPAALEEGLTAGEAIRRSTRLTYGAKGRIFVLILVLYAIGYAAFLVVYLVAAIVGAIGFFVASGSHMQLTNPLAIVAIAFVAIVVLCAVFLWSALFYSAMAVALSVLYHDQRRRFETPPPAQAAYPSLPGQPA